MLMWFVRQLVGSQCDKETCWDNFLSIDFSFFFLGHYILYCRFPRTRCWRQICRWRQGISLSSKCWQNCRLPQLIKLMRQIERMSSSLDCCAPLQFHSLGPYTASQKYHSVEDIRLSHYSSGHSCPSVRGGDDQVIVPEGDFSRFKVSPGIHGWPAKLWRCGNDFVIIGRALSQ